MASTVEVVFASADWRVVDSSEVEDPLEEALAAAQAGEVESGGVRPGEVFFRIGCDDPEATVDVVRRALRRLGAPESTRLLVDGRRLPI